MGVTPKDICTVLRMSNTVHGATKCERARSELADKIEREGLAAPAGFAMVQVPEGFQFNLELAEGALRKLSAIGPITPPEALQIMCVISGAKAMLADAGGETE